MTQTHPTDTKMSWCKSNLTCWGTSEELWLTCVWYFIHWIELNQLVHHKHDKHPPSEYKLSCDTVTIFLLSSWNSAIDPFLLIPFSIFRAFPASKDSPHKARLSAHNNSNNEPFLTSSVRTSITITNEVGFKADPEWKPTSTEKEFGDSLSIETAVLQLLHSDITPFTKYSVMPFILLFKKKTNNFWYQKSILDQRIQKRTFIFQS